jgi:hypothetical protein
MVRESTLRARASNASIRTHGAAAGGISSSTATLNQNAYRHSLGGPPPSGTPTALTGDPKTISTIGAGEISSDIITTTELQPSHMPSPPLRDDHQSFIPPLSPLTTNSPRASQAFTPNAGAPSMSVTKPSINKIEENLVESTTTNVSGPSVTHTPTINQPLPWVPSFSFDNAAPSMPTPSPFATLSSGSKRSVFDTKAVTPTRGYKDNILGEDKKMVNPFKNLGEHRSSSVSLKEATAWVPEKHWPSSDWDPSYPMSYSIPKDIGSSALESKAASKYTPAPPTATATTPAARGLEFGKPAMPGQIVSPWGTGESSIRIPGVTESWAQYASDSKASKSAVGKRHDLIPLNGQFKDDSYKGRPGLPVESRPSVSFDIKCKTTPSKFVYLIIEIFPVVASNSCT